MLFGDASTTKMYEHDPRVELHGPGFSKVILGDDAADEWEKYLDVMVQSISANGGRSCINASAIWTPKNADKIAQAVAEKLATWQALPADRSRRQARRLRQPDHARADQRDDRRAAAAGARDLTQEIRGTPRLVKEGRVAWLLPTIIRCDRDHAAGEQGVPLPVRERDRVPAGRDPRGDRRRRWSAR